MSDNHDTQSLNNIGGGASSSTRDKPMRPKLKTRGANLTPKQIQDANDLIGQCIYKEQDGVRIYGTVIHFLSRMNLLKIQYEDNTDKLLKPDEVLSILRNANPNNKDKEDNVNPEDIDPQEFRGVIICDKYNGVKCLGIVIAYSPEKNKLQVQYRADNRSEYISRTDALYKMAKDEDIRELLQASSARTSSTNTIDKKKRKADLVEESTPAKKKKTKSGDDEMTSEEELEVENVE